MQYAISIGTSCRATIISHNRIAAVLAQLNEGMRADIYPIPDGDVLCVWSINHRGCVRLLGEFADEDETEATVRSIGGRSTGGLLGVGSSSTADALNRSQSALNRIAEQSQREGLSGLRASETQATNIVIESMQERSSRTTNVLARGLESQQQLHSCLVF